MYKDFFMCFLKFDLNFSILTDLLFASFQAHQDVFKKLVDLIGITSIMEVKPSIWIASFCICKSLLIQLVTLLLLLVGDSLFPFDSLISGLGATCKWRRPPLPEFFGCDAVVG